MQLGSAPLRQPHGVPTVGEFGLRVLDTLVYDQGVPGKVVAQLMGHANVDTTLNVYTQVLDGSLRAAVDTVGSKLFTIVHNPENPGALTH